MKNKKIVILCIPIIVVVLILVGFTMVFSKENIQKNVDGVKFDKKWNRIMAREINKNKINLKVDGRTIECNGETPYMTNKMELMIPISVISDAFNCAKNVYNGKEILIEKGSNKATLYFGKQNIKFNENNYKISNGAKKINDSIYVSAKVFSKYLNYSYKWNSKSNTASFTNTATGNSYLPKKYSYVENNKIVKIKNQGKYGTCWAFATLTALETSLMPEQKFDFSEDNMIYNNALSDDIQDGGEYIRAMAYLMSWKGPVLEKDDPYGDGKTNKNLKSVKHVQEAEIVPYKDYEQIKEMVFKYGGVESSMYMSMSDADGSSMYYNKKYNAYCYKGDNKPNHDVVIVGWDDDFSKDYFNDKTIKGNGAFICVNSWGESFGDKGIFYISYYDDRIGSNNVCYTKVEDTNNYDNIYQSDLCGFTGSMGFEGSSSVYFANVYQGKNNEKLDAVGFYATSTDLEYEVFICENFESQESLNNRNHMAASGTIKNQGYYTINLDKEYNISKEKKFAVIVKVSKDKSEKFYKLIPVEMESKEMAVKIDLSDGEGYFSSQGYSWQSAEKQQCNICLKAYTKNK